MPRSTRRTGPFLQARIKLGHYRNLLFDWRYGVDTCGQQSAVQLGVAPHTAGEVHGFSSSSISAVRAILAHLPIQPADWVFADLGCGKARTMLMAGRHDFKQILGVEHASALVEVARANVDRYAGRMRCRQIEVISGDALDFIPPPDENLLVYLFNPFSQELLARCLHNLCDAPIAPRRRRLVCFVQQSSPLARYVDPHELCADLKSIPMGGLPHDWLSHPQVEASLFEVQPHD